MADFIIKSAAGTGNKTLIQGQDQSGSNYAIEIGDAGALKLGTISAGTVSTGVTFPRGHIINYAGVRDEAVAANVQTSSTTMEDTGITIPITAAQSSTNSFFRVSFFSSMLQSVQNAEGYVDCMMTTTNTTTYAQGESIMNTTYPTYVHPSTSNDYYYPFYWRAYCGLETEMGLPATKSTWAAGDSLHFRWFFKRGTGTFKICHVNGSWTADVEEVAR